MNPTAPMTAYNELEVQRQSIVRLIFLLFLLLIFEGALRKWVLPGLSNPLLFIRDPFLLAVYVKALQQRRIAMNSLLQFGLLLSVCLTALALLQVSMGDVPLVVAGYGLRNYSLYLPLPFVMYASMTAADTTALIRLLLMVSIPEGALGVIQSYLPTDHFLNQGLGDGDVFTAGNQARTYGTFTFTAGFGNYINTMVPIATGSMLFFPAGSQERRLAILATLSLVCAALTSGSRGVIVGVALTAAMFILVTGLIGGGRSIIRALSTTVLIFLITTAGYFMFSDRFENIITRFQDGESAEGSIIDRGLTPLTKLVDAISDGSILGVGIGKGTGGGSYLVTGTQDLILSEEETLRVIQECGAVLGTGYFAFRLMLLAFSFRMSINSLKCQGNPLPFLLLSFLTPSLLIGQITLNNTSNGFNWLGLGLLFCMAHLQARPSR